ncbi:unnamed protein product [Acanthoscelides obtectus]|uniref:Uncharacterized protein n=1 Tax=Acanthoscelides obtectus TaxID=200917 RepID=A0A9P0MFJ5_ACAOB|nr:unnamed protein product [Acanthoscelides obtectus]CAK1658578.1 hypothetical protein AOBTE_LOCUS21000 [Acanthoscelides obtectus]
MRLLRNYSDCFFLLCLSFYVLFFWFVEGADAEAATNSSALIKSAVEGLSRGGREYNLIYARLIGCAVQRDTRCFVDIAEDFLENKRNELLAQADREILQRVGGRADQTNTPSQLAKSIEKIIFELSSLFKNGIGGLLSPRDGDEELEDEEEEKTEDETKDGVSSRGSAKQEEARGKKKKQKKQQYLHKLKLLAIGGIIAAKLCLLLKLAQTALLLKLVLIGLGIFAVNVAKLLALWKAAKQKTIYYENSHHDHHYDHEDVWGQEDHWDRGGDAQDLAYAGQKSSGWSFW